MSNPRGVIYYLPGRGGRLDAGLGKALLDRGFSIFGRETFGAFQKLRFTDQIELIAKDIKSEFWREDALLIANSFGAYLFLHAQTLMAPFPGKVLLLSPIIGGSAAPGNGPRFLPPFAERLLALAKTGDLRVGNHYEIHVGEFDWQSDPQRVTAFGRLLDIPVSIVPDGRHLLDKVYVSRLLDRWLPSQALIR